MSSLIGPEAPLIRQDYEGQTTGSLKLSQQARKTAHLDERCRVIGHFVRRQLRCLEPCHRAVNRGNQRRAYVRQRRDDPVIRSESGSHAGSLNHAPDPRIAGV